MINIPLMVGAMGTMIAPQLAAVNAIAILLSHNMITVEKEEEL